MKSTEDNYTTFSKQKCLRAPNLRLPLAATSFRFPFLVKLLSEPSSLVCSSSPKNQPAARVLATQYKVHNSKHSVAVVCM